MSTTPRTHPHRPAPRRSIGRRGAALAGLVATAVLAVAAPAASRVERAAAPERPVQSASDGRRTLTVSQNTNLDPNGQAVTVTGSGFEEHKGIYLAFCVEPLPGQKPTPCGGGIDMEGETGASVWISSNPPDYGVGLAIPYGPGGSFSQTISISPMIGNIDCRRVQCVVASRNDHTRASDRSQDLFVPISFATPQEPVDPGPDQPGPGPDPTQPATTTTTVPQPLPDEARPAPDSTLSDDGRSVTAGDLRLSAERVTDLDPDGEGLVVTGAGFDEERGLSVAFCAVGDDGSIGACADEELAKQVGGEAVARIEVSSNPSAARAESSIPYGPLGSFGATLAVAAEIDGDTDCREVTCAVVTRPHPDRPQDRGQDLVLPVAFEEEEPPATTTTVAATTTTAPAAPADDEADDDDSSSAVPIIAAVAALLVVAGIVTAVVLRRRSAAAAAAGAGANGAADGAGDAGAAGAAGAGAAGAAGAADAPTEATPATEADAPDADEGPDADGEA